MVLRILARWALWGTIVLAGVVPSFATPQTVDVESDDYFVDYILPILAIPKPVPQQGKKYPMIPVTPPGDAPSSPPNVAQSQYLSCDAFNNCY